MIANVSISIHELLAVARESEGVKAVQRDAMLCEKRFAPDTRYMVEFLVLKQTEKFGEAGIYHRYFLTKKAYYEMVELQNRGILRFQRLALVLEGTLHYLPVQTFVLDRVLAEHWAGKTRLPAGAPLRGARGASMGHYNSREKEGGVRADYRH